MTIPYNRYLQTKDNCLISYYGTFDEFVLQLNYIRPVLEQSLNGINIYIGCKGSLRKTLGEFDRIVYDEKNLNCYYQKELIFDQINHPIVSIIEDCNLKFTQNSIDSKTNKCVICTKNLPPFGPMTSEEIEKCRRLALSKGFEVEIDGVVENAGWVIGIENAALYKAACAGVKCSLIPRRIGTKLFQYLFPKFEILNMANI